MAYVVVVAIHVVAALAGFGAVALGGVYAHSARHLERPGVLEETVRYFRARAVAEWALVAVPVLGAVAVVVDPHGKGLGHLWVGLAILLWLAAAVAAGGVARPARAALRAQLPLDRAHLPLDGPEPDSPEAAGVDRAAAQRAAGRLSAAAAVCDVVFVLAVIDMVLRP